MLNCAYCLCWAGAHTGPSNRWMGLTRLLTNPWVPLDNVPWTAPCAGWPWAARTTTAAGAAAAPRVAALFLLQPAGDSEAVRGWPQVLLARSHAGSPTRGIAPFITTTRALWRGLTLHGTPSCMSQTDRHRSGHPPREHFLMRCARRQVPRPWGERAFTAWSSPQLSTPLRMPSSPPLHHRSLWLSLSLAREAGEQLQIGSGSPRVDVSTPKHATS